MHDLTNDAGEVRPIELQIVGSQLQAENIATLGKYKPKEKLVEGFLEGVIQDCGKENEDATLMILYLLTNENNTRPFKTRSELMAELKNSAIYANDKQLELILEILTGSGLVFLVPEKPENRYQNVHDNLEGMIREKGKGIHKKLNAV